MEKGEVRTIPDTVA